VQHGTHHRDCVLRAAIDRSLTCTFRLLAEVTVRRDGGHTVGCAMGLLATKRMSRVRNPLLIILPNVEENILFELKNRFSIMPLFFLFPPPPATRK
jgi:hypothetical protein